jgi:hypothetical protein
MSPALRQRAARCAMTRLLPADAGHPGKHEEGE